MIQFADSDSIYSVPALGYTSERAEYFISKNNKIVNQYAPLIATANIHGYFLVKLASFFRYQEDVKIAPPSLTDIENIKIFPEAIQSYKVITKVKGNEIKSEEIQIIAGSSSYDFLSRYANRFLSNFPIIIFYFFQ